MLLILKQNLKHVGIIETILCSQLTTSCKTLDFFSISANAVLNGVGVLGVASKMVLLIHGVFKVDLKKLN